MIKEQKNTDIIGTVTALFCLIALYIFPATVKRSTADALLLCGRSIIPALFPFLTVTRLLLHFLSGKIDKKNCSTVGTVQSVYKYTALILGLISGYPTGAVVACQMYESGIISRNDAEKAAMFSSVASPAFCINFFGAEIMNDRLSGLLIYVSSVLVNIVLMLIYTFFFENKNEDIFSIKNSDTGTSSTVSQLIYDSSMTMISICAYITFFMCMGEVIFSVLSFFFPICESMKAPILGTAEITSGVASLSGADYSKRFMYGSAIIGFGGTSAIMQVKSVCTKYGLKCQSLIFIKLACAVLVPLSAFVLTVICGTGDRFLKVAAIILILCTFSSIFAFFVYFLKKRVKKYQKSKVIL